MFISKLIGFFYVKNRFEFSKCPVEYQLLQESFSVLGSGNNIPHSYF